MPDAADKSTNQPANRAHVRSFRLVHGNQTDLTGIRRIEYAKKKDKKQLITFKRDETVLKDDNYKSHVVSVATGEPANSISRPAAKRKARPARPITQGKLLKAGGPSGVREGPVSCQAESDSLYLSFSPSLLLPRDRNRSLSHNLCRDSRHRLHHQRLQ